MARHVTEPGKLKVGPFICFIHTHTYKLMQYRPYSNTVVLLNAWILRLTHHLSVTTAATSIAGTSSKRAANTRADTNRRSHTQTHQSGAQIRPRTLVCAQAAVDGPRHSARCTTASSSDGCIKNST